MASTNGWEQDYDSLYFDWRTKNLDVRKTSEWTDRTTAAMTGTTITWTEET